MKNIFRKLWANESLNMACLQIYRELSNLPTFLWVHLNSKEVSYLFWQNTYPNLKTTCHIKLKIPSIPKASLEITLEGIPSLTKTTIPAPKSFRFRRKGNVKSLILLKCQRFLWSDPRGHQIYFSMNLYSNEQKWFDKYFSVAQILKLLKQGSSDEISSFSDLYSSYSTKLFKNSPSQKLDRKNFNKIFAKIIFSLLFKCNHFFPKCSSLILLFLIYSIFVCEQ